VSLQRARIPTMDIAIVVLVAVIAATGGLGIGFLLGASRGGGGERRLAELQAQLGAARENANRLGVQSAELEREAERLRGQLLESVQQGSQFEERTRQLEMRLTEERQETAQNLKLMAEAREAMENMFKSHAADALRNNNQSFLELAKATLAEFQQGAKGDLEKRQIAIDQLVGPVRASLDKVDEKIAALERARENAYGEIRQQFTQMSAQHKQLADQTGNLVNALRQSHVRGRWGEIQLRRVVEMAGMMQHCDFVEQQGAESDDGRLRPDLIVKLPGGRQIVVDSKAPINAYMEAHEATNDDLRKAKIQLHAQQVRRHLDALAKKSYWEQFQPTPEVVVMFIPGEAFYSAALEADPTLLDSAFDQSVIIASPASLMALLKAASYGWRQEAIADNAREISQLGQELHGRLGTLAEHFARMGRGLASATGAYNDAMASFETRVLSSARKFKGLGATSQEAEIIELRAIEGGARKLQNGLFDGETKG
jgi:DNA recombination protein RmuC